MTLPEITALLIEDNPADARLIREYIAEMQHTSIHFRWTRSLSEGLEQLNTAGGIQIVLLDLSLPDCHGPDTFHQISARAAELPVIILTGYDDENLATQIVAQGAQDYLVKGQFDHRLLERTIRYAIQRKNVEADLKRRNRILAMMIRAGRAFNATLDLDEVMSRVLEEFQQELDSPGAFWLVDGQSGELVCRQASGHHQEMVRGWRLKLGEGIAGWVAQNGESVILPEVSRSARHYKGVDRLTGQETNSVLAVPICSKGKVLGVLQLIDERIGRFDQVDKDLVEALASTAAIAIENAHLFDEVQQLSITDQLTGLYNRRGFSNLANQQLKLSERVGMPLTLIFIDIDNMKWINDGQGHLQGDQALLATARILEESFRDADLKARLGGDEFVVLALNAPLESQGALKARLNRHLEGYNARGENTFQLSFSIGMASLDHLDQGIPFSLEELISRADAAMYAEKTGKKKLL